MALAHVHTARKLRHEIPEAYTRYLMPALICTHGLSLSACGELRFRVFSLVEIFLPVTFLVSFDSRKEKALVLLEKAAEYQVALRGENHPGEFAIRMAQGRLCAELNQAKNALAFFAKVLWRVVVVFVWIYSVQQSADINFFKRKYYFFVFRQEKSRFLRMRRTWILQMCTRRSQRYLVISA